LRNVGRRADRQAEEQAGLHGFSDVDAFLHRLTGSLLY
jgi:hypothetical protein